MTVINIDIQTSRGLQKLLDNAPELVDEAIHIGLRRCGDEIRNRAGDMAPYKTGNLRRSLTIDLSEDEVTVGTNLEYARIHDKGGEIRAKNKPYLVFQINGHWVRTKKVTIPKYKGRGYMTPAYKEMADGGAKQIFVEEINRIL